VDLRLRRRARFRYPPHNFDTRLPERSLYGTEDSVGIPLMPVTARLSKAFYDRFGEQVTNELVDWFNQVDATYRSELRELNEINFARFDAKLEQRIAEVKAEIARIDQRMISGLADQRADLIKWMFLFWVGTVVPILGVVLALR
jgi:hypothetical protein